jgi:hypothetical protein
MPRAMSSQGPPASVAGVGVRVWQWSVVVVWRECYGVLVDTYRIDAMVVGVLLQRYTSEGGGGGPVT